MERRRLRIRPAARGFSLVEMLLAVFILAIGVISISALFPAGIVLQRQATDDLLGPIAAKNAFATIRSKLSQDDFGSFQQFGSFPAYDEATLVNGGTIAPVGGTGVPQVSGDWGWMRPGFLFGNAANPADAGTIDVFSAAYTRQQLGFPTTTVGQLATEMPDGGAFQELYGIPYNLRKYPLFFGDWDRDFDIDGNDRTAAIALTPLEQAIAEPSVTFTQSERAYPQGPANYGTGAAGGNATYYWDCMFRRNGGTVQVAVFVYRVSAPGGEPRGYVTARTPTGAGTGAPAGAFNPSQQLPPIPAFYRAPNAGANVSWPNRTNALGGPGNTTANGYLTPPAANEIPGTAPNTAGSFGGADATWDDWQAPDAWWIDNHASVHRVLNGRLALSQGPVRLARPIPLLPNTPTNGFVPSASPAYPQILIEQNPATPKRFGPGGWIQGIWFVPRRDSAGNVLTPVFAAVEEL